MSLTRDDVNQIARLARLSLDGEETDALTGSLSRIIDFVQQLESADTEGVVPMAHPVPTAQRLRTDEVTEDDRRDLYQENAAAVAEGLYLVPRVIE